MYSNPLYFTFLHLTLIAVFLIHALHNLTFWDCFAFIFKLNQVRLIAHLLNSLLLVVFLHWKHCSWPGKETTMKYDCCNKYSTALNAFTHYHGRLLPLLSEKEKHQRDHTESFFSGVFRHDKSRSALYFGLSRPFKLMTIF